MRVLNSRQMREADRRAIDDFGIPSIVLMENAGRQVVAAMEAHFEIADLRVAILCGHGNNGGDGLVVARTLAERGIDVGIYLIGQASDVRGDARVNLEIVRKLGLDVVEIGDASAWELHVRDVTGADLIVDAIFGTGLKGPVAGFLETVIADVNDSGQPVISIDLPTGLSADTHEIPGPAIDATMTVTLAAPKIPLVLPPAETRAGDLVIADIGIPGVAIEELEGPTVEILTKSAMRALVQPRQADAHKGDFGRVLIVAGSVGKAGAAYLSAMAALRSGAGLVTIATPRSCASTLASLGAEYMIVPLDEAPDGTITATAAESILAIDADVIAVGPGLGRSAAVSDAMHALVERAGVPLVVDADGLNAFEGAAGALVGRDGFDLIITPHPGEMSRLVGLSAESVQSHRLDVAREFASSHRAHVVLKGHRTVIAGPEGNAAINLTGNPGMATAGSGDVLTGVIAAWCAQLLDAEAATRLAVYLHGLAGDLAEADGGAVALIAGDIVDHLGDAVLELTARREKTGAS